MDVKTGRLKAEGRAFAIVAARFNDFVTSKLLEGAVDELVRLGADEAEITVAWVPGAFEIPTAAARLAKTNRYAAVICLGTVIRGQTAHFEHVAGQCASGIAAVGRQTGVPTILGVLATENLEQAIDRAGGKHGNKGAEAAASAVEMADLLAQLD
ncbi:MAG TPA: 6,7-dimethyl-8-ribityllumazine synthase [Candidatus Dormibacteraeota bacterium]|jgi:6,7-dimethyl-8-ribityllumazine synthase|nr:6,7-dimethyl-8-ribityllumazine synthase [Candidatus Dormibacteraeota bacterium]